MNSLPDEVLLEVFKYVASRDRRNSIRLVCRRWNRLADDQIVANDEWIVVHCQHLDRYCWPNGSKLEENLSKLRLSGRKILNLFFKTHSFHQNKLVHEFWATCGRRVRSLVFEGCLLTYTDLENILFRSPFVESISLSWNKSLNLDRWIRSVALDPLFTCHSVSSFSIELDSSDAYGISYDSMHKILSTFPDLEELKIVIHSRYSYKPGTVWFRHNELLPLEQAPLTAIAHYIQTHSNKLKKLWLVQPNSSLPPTDEPMEFSTILSELKNLEELAVTGKQFLNFDKQMPELFLKRMPKLTVLILSQIPISGRNSCVEILNEILDILPNLQVLLFESDEHILKFDEFLIEKILSSKLKRLHLLRCWIYVDHEERNNHLRVHSVNRTLEELVIIPTTELVSVYNPSEILNIMLQYCKNLRYVAISHPDEEVVQNVFKYHKCLKSLMLWHCQNLSDYAFSGSNIKRKSEKPYTIRELHDLEYLIIREMNPHLVTKKICPFFALPKLKSLEMDFVAECCNNKHEPSFINDLIQALRKNTRLEAVELHVRIESDLPETAIKQLLSSLKKLRYFTLTYKLENGFSQGQSIVEKIQDFFEVCPSLRYIVYQRRYFSRFRTPTNGYEIKEVSRSCVKPDKPRELCPDWYSLCKYEPGMYSNLDGIGNEHL